MAFNDGRKFQSKAEEADDKEFVMSLEMENGGRAYSRVQHDKFFTTHASTAKNCGEAALICGSGLKTPF